MCKFLVLLCILPIAVMYFCHKFWITCRNNANNIYFCRGTDYPQLFQRVHLKKLWFKIGLVILKLHHLVQTCKWLRELRRLEKRLSKLLASVCTLPKLTCAPIEKWNSPSEKHEFSGVLEMNSKTKLNSPCNELKFWFKKLVSMEEFKIENCVIVATGESPQNRCELFGPN